MRILNTMVSCGFVYGILLCASHANAESLSSTTLGETPVNYLEHRLSINEFDEVAWTEIDSSGHPKARYTDGISGTTEDLHATLPAPLSGFVHSRTEDINNNQVIAGYAANSLETTRQAVVWLRSGGSYQGYSLHEVVEAQTGTPHAWTAAYGVSESINSHVVVIGQRRESLDTRSIPVIWLINTSTLTITVQDLPFSSSDYGIGYDVIIDLEDSQSNMGATEYRIYGTGGMGMSTGSTIPGASAYMFASLWSGRISVKGSSVSLPASWNVNFIPSVDPTSHATSVGTRTAIAEVDGTPVPYLVGSAIDTSKNSTAFICELSGGSTTNCEQGNSDGPTPDGALQSLGYGLSSWSGSAAGFPTIVGSSNTTGTILDGGDPPPNPMYGYYGYSPTYSAQSTAESHYVCIAEDDVNNRGMRVKSVYDTNRSGSMIARTGNQAVLLTHVPPSPPAQIYRRSSADVPQDYWWVEYEDLPAISDSATPNGGFIFSEAPGCAAFTTCVSSTSSLSGNAGDNAVQGDWEGVYQQEPTDSGFTPYSAQQFGSPPFGSSYPSSDIPQLKFQAGVSYNTAICDWAEVNDFDSTAPLTDAHVVLNPRWDPFGGIWRDCNGDTVDGYEKDVSFDENNCGGCGIVCPSNASCYEGACTSVLISEFLYDPPHNDPGFPNGDHPYEFIEIYVDGGTIDISGYEVSDQQGGATIPGGTVLSGGYYVIAACATDIEAAFGTSAYNAVLFEWGPANGASCIGGDDPNVPNITPTGGNGALQLENSGSDLAIHNAGGLLVDGVSYAGDNAYTPHLADISDPEVSWSLADLANHDLAGSWAIKTTSDLPTPGAAH